MNEVLATRWPTEACSISASKTRALRIAWPLTAVMLVAAAVYIGTCAWPVILDETDGQYAGAAREMLQRGDWLVPTNNGVPRLQKPPLVYWVTMLSLKTFGINEFAARLPNAMATLAWIFATYLIGKRIGGEHRGLLAATMLGSMMGLFLFTHRIMPEPFLAGCISMTVWCFLNALQYGAVPSDGSANLTRTNHPKAKLSTRKWFLWAWFFMGLGVLSKGLHGALWPLVIVGASAALQPGTRSTWKKLFSLSGAVVFLGMTAPWYIVMAHRFPGFLSYHFFNEQAGHAFNMHTPRDCEQVPLLTFWGQHLLYLFPWIFLLPAVLVAKIKNLKNKALPSSAPHAHTPFNGEATLWIWVAITAFTISFSARQDHYSMTCWGALAVCLSTPLGTRRGAPKLSWISLPATSMLLVGGLIILAAIAVQHPLLAAATQVQPEAARDTIHRAIRGISAQVWRDCTPLAIAAGALLAIGGAFAALLFAQRRTTRAIFMLAGTMALIFPFAMRGYAQIEEYFSLADVAKAINCEADADALIVCEGEPHLSSSLFFYLDRQVSWAGAQTGSIVAAEAHGIPVGPFVSDADLASAWHSSRNVYFILEQANRGQWESLLGVGRSEERVVARDGTRIVLTNHAHAQTPGSPDSTLASAF